MNRSTSGSVSIVKVQASIPNCSIVIVTRNRSQTLASTLSRIAAISDGTFETIVVDNGSTDETLQLRDRCPQVRWITLDKNLCASARNVGAMAARGRVLLMLDDDSWPEPDVINRLVRAFDARPSLGAIACRVRLADAPHRHDAGGVPGAFFNCGAAIRRNAFLDAGGYPIDYDYYVEEYALSCELWRRGWRVESMGAALVWHQRTAVNRDVERMLRYLVRNNIGLWNTYAPASRRELAIQCDMERYHRIALKENAIAGYELGIADAASMTASRRRRPLTLEQFDSLLGLDRLRQTLRNWADKRSVCRIAIWTRGKGSEFIIECAKSVGLRVACVYDSRLADQDSASMWRGLPIHDTNDAASIDADALLPGTLSPGVAEDSCEHLRRRFRDVEIINPARWGDAPDARGLDVPSATHSCVA